jgi:Tfp pilus assembly protein PilV
MQAHRHKRLSKPGFTLVEVMVTTLIFMLTSLGVIQAILQARRLAETSLRCTIARNVAQSVIEQSRNLTFEELLGGTPLVAKDLFKAGNDISLSKGVATDITVDFRNTTTGATDDMKVTVTYNAVTSNPATGRALVVSVDYSWHRLLENNPKHLQTARLSYVRGDL